MPRYEREDIAAMLTEVRSLLLRVMANNHHPDRIVTLATVRTPDKQGPEQVSLPNFVDWHDRSTSFAALASYMAAEYPVILGSTAEYARAAQTAPESEPVTQTWRRASLHRWMAGVPGSAGWWMPMPPVPAEAGRPAEASRSCGVSGDVRLEAQPFVLPQGTAYSYADERKYPPLGAAFTGRQSLL